MMIMGFGWSHWLQRLLWQHPPSQAEGARQLQFQSDERQQIRDQQDALERELSRLEVLTYQRHESPVDH